ncbi:hypothetical protein [Gracilimonas sediminicola]|uniref:hypothetical protein n=1 Tax=Gracilimonas sediminicola TaxID=2952158 RepID=UPI0038D3E779
MKNKTLKIVFTVIWTIIGIWIIIPADNGRQIGDAWMEGGSLVVKTSEVSWYNNLGYFVLFMIPVIGIWIYSFISQYDTKKKPVKRKSRMM